MAEKGLPVRDRKFGEGHYLRPQFIQPYRCQNVLIEDVLRQFPDVGNPSGAFQQRHSSQPLKSAVTDQITTVAILNRVGDVLDQGLLLRYGDDCMRSSQVETRMAGDCTRLLRTL